MSCSPARARRRRAARARAGAGRQRELRPVAAVVRQLAGIDDDDPQDRITERLRDLVDGCCDVTETDRVVGGLGLSLGLAEPNLDESAFVQDVQGGSCVWSTGSAPACRSCWRSRTRTSSPRRCST